MEKIDESLEGVKYVVELKYFMTIAKTWEQRLELKHLKIFVLQEMNKDIDQIQTLKKV